MTRSLLRLAAIACACTLAAGCMRLPAPDTTAVADRRAPQGATNPAVGAEFKAFALNALLLPLLDDAVPARWADPALALDCDDAQLSVNGMAPEVGEPVDEAFAVRWRLHGCRPFGPHLSVSGEVELAVVRYRNAYVATVRPRTLRIASQAGHDVLFEPFEAKLATLATAPVP